MSADEAMSLGLVDGVWTAKHEQAVNALAKKKMKSDTRMAQLGGFLHMLAEAVERGESITMERTSEG